MIVWITHVKVGHRQTPYKQKPSGEHLGVFVFDLCDLLEFMTTLDRALLRRWLSYAQGEFAFEC